MDTAQLAAFVAVVDVGSFTRAAARLNVSQPTVTTRIQALEQGVGTPLLERLPRGVRLTPAGVDLLPYARDIMTLTERARQAVMSGGQPHGRLEVGTVESLTTYRLLPLVEYLYRRYPDLRISLRSPACGETIARVRDGGLDCAFFVDSAASHADLETVVLCQEPLVLVGAPDHLLVGRHRVTDDDLLGATLVRADHGADYHQGLERVVAPGAGHERPRILELDSITAAKRGVANGMGMALLPLVAVRQELAAGTLHRIDWEPPFRVYTQVTWRRGVRSAAVRALVDAAAQVIEDQLAGT
ncbi:LysR family transcriptional regulator [Actinophytocola algeriensis]|uniref:DNA-binding transcriptional LysR family regulator n=1 Tax=Actinophytocola algeriensis TaxID=1768010 RepID=A0A7W7Q8V2_9PSEU|nr:LysR family transcriptional regulator [Actinophytocola algeriensis]MBB4909175.1 DNA-binding transcriptional LysR family regulator [Actinophytocola algeriensis]MBE1474437.1 DNA-binding transcriptional LysR family regulator [Actinophytocola algeriensis]